LGASGGRNAASETSSSSTTHQTLTSGNALTTAEATSVSVLAVVLVGGWVDALRGSKTAGLLTGATVAACATVGLASDLANLRQAGSLLGGADGEDGALPLLALAGKLLVLSSLGRNTAG